VPDEALSQRLRTVAKHEREVVADRVASLQEQSNRLQEMLRSVEEDLAGAVRLAAQLDEMLGIAPQLSIADHDVLLRGQRLRSVAIQVLKRHRGVHATVHYRDWFELIVTEGHRVGGKDPLATFLAQLSRSPEVEKLGRRTGMYRLAAA
jgi:hypothetical protein